MPKAKFVSLICHRPSDISEDDTGFDVGQEDEPYLMVNKKRIWDGRMGINDVEDLTGINPVDFKDDLRVELWDRDAGYISGKDDLLGSFTIQTLQAGLGELEHQFKRKKANYTLTYKVE
jgi:hypothetical protein